MTISSRSPLHVTRDGDVLRRPRSTAGVHAYSTGREPPGRGCRCTRVKLPAWLVLLACGVARYTLRMVGLGARALLHVPIW